MSKLKMIDLLTEHMLSTDDYKPVPVYLFQLWAIQLNAKITRYTHYGDRFMRFTFPDGTTYEIGCEDR